jgi:hypothetical protein
MFYEHRFSEKLCSKKCEKQNFFNPQLGDFIEWKKWKMENFDRIKSRTVLFTIIYALVLTKQPSLQHSGNNL